MASRTSSATVKPSLAENRAARRIRSASSENDSSGVPGVRRTFSLSAARPPNGSTSSWAGSRAAMALTVKSRRRRSASRDVPYRTAGFRDRGPYSSLRYVVISKMVLFFRSPTVPKSIPTVHTVSAQFSTIFRTSAGGALVVRSRSPGSRPRNTSRTGPPTRASSYPWPANSRPRSSAAGDTRRSRAAAAFRCSSFSGFTELTGGREVEFGTANEGKGREKARIPGDTGDGRFRGLPGMRNDQRWKVPNMPIRSPAATVTFRKRQ